MKRTMASVVLVGLFVTILAGCSTLKKQADGVPPENPDVTVQVTNQDWLDITVYAVYLTRRYRLGRVSTGKTEVFVLPGAVLEGTTSLRFVAVPLSSRQERLTEGLVINPGDQISLVNDTRRLYVGYSGG